LNIFGQLGCEKTYREPVNIRAGEFFWARSINIIIYNKEIIIMALKTYSFTLSIEKHNEIIKWIKENQETDLNFSALMRKLLREEINRRKDAQKIRY